MSAAYLAWIGLRLSFIVGVSSSPPGGPLRVEDGKALDLLDARQAGVGGLERRGDLAQVRQRHERLAVADRGPEVAQRAVADVRRRQVGDQAAARRDRQDRRHRPGLEHRVGMGELRAPRRPARPLRNRSRARGCGRRRRARAVRVRRRPPPRRARRASAGPRRPRSGVRRTASRRRAVRAANIPIQSLQPPVSLRPAARAQAAGSPPPQSARRRRARAPPAGSLLPPPAA